MPEVAVLERLLHLFVGDQISDGVDACISAVAFMRHGYSPWPFFLGGHG